MKPSVQPAVRQQLGMASLFDDAPGIERDDAVGALDGRQPVRDDEAGAPAHQRLERLLHEALAFGVERGRRLVEDQYRRVLVDRACDRHALALAARELAAVVPDDRIDAL